eukprot:XP_790301.3 PREDICTED: transforming growth factor beta regulator 1 [Strongylocentrotus purpuratus]
MGAFPGYPYQPVMPPLESPTSLLQARLQHSPGFPFPQHGAMHPQVFFSGYDDQGGQRAPPIDKMSWLDAAEIILEEAQQPLHLKDIKQRIVEQGLVGPNARSSLETLMHRDAQKGSKRFVKLDELIGVFRLMTAEERKAARRSNKKAPKQTAPKTAAPPPTTAVVTTTTTTAMVAAEATTEPTTVKSPTAAAQAERNAKFKRKSQNLRRLIKAMVFENAALCDEVSRTEAKLPRARAERRFLLLRLLHYQSLTGKPLLDTDQQPTVKKEKETEKKETEKMGRKEKTEKVARKEKDRERKKVKNRHKHKKNKKASKDADKKLEAQNQLKKKKPSSSLKRHILPIPLNDAGQPIYPIVQGSLTVHSLGKVLSDKVTFHSDRFIYPAGFHSTRVYGNMNDPKEKCVYTCKIVNCEGEAIFEISDDRVPPTILSASSATKCHRKLLQAVNKAFGEDIVNESRDRSQEFFGFSHPTIQNLIQSLPGATQCMAYRWLRFEECKPEEREKIAHWYESDPTVCFDALRSAFKKKMDEKQATVPVSTSTSTPPTSSTSTTISTSILSTTLSVPASTTSSESHNLRSLLTSAPIVTIQQSISARLDGFSGGDGN